MYLVLSNLGWVTDVAESFDTITNLIVGIVFVRYCYGYRWLSFSFVRDDKSAMPNTFIVQMRAKDVNCASLTQAVSSTIYNGEFIPPEIRKQVIDYTNPQCRIING